MRGTAAPGTTGGDSDHAGRHRPERRTAPRPRTTAPPAGRPLGARLRDNPVTRFRRRVQRAWDRPLTAYYVIAAPVCS
ncbi:hypothetical protein ACFQVA_08605 [Actinomadura keratinilytica]